MAKTVIGLFDSARMAQQAVVELVDSGIPREEIGITSQHQFTGEHRGQGSPAANQRVSEEGITDKISNFFSSLFGGDGAEDASHYSEAVSRGGTVVTVDAGTDEVADRAAAIMDRYGADVDEQDAGSQSTGYEEGRANLAEGTEARVPVVEEELQVGKREVERGRVRIRSRVIERPVEEVVRLREERVRVERRPVNRPVTEDDLQSFRSGAIEITERAEVPVIAKEARVVEEVAISKEVGERTETVRDTVRRTDVDVQETGSEKVRGASASTQTQDPRE